MAAKFQLVPVTLDPGLAQVSLDIGGQTLTYATARPRPQCCNGRRPDGKTLVRVTMTPADGKAGDDRRQRRPLGAAAPAGRRAGDAERPAGQVPHHVHRPGGTASFELNASSVRNPFTLAALRTFRCPPKL